MNKLFFLVFICGSVSAQDTIVFPKIDVFKRNIIEISYGIPLGNLANKYESSITSAFYVRTKIAKQQKLLSELGDIKVAIKDVYQYKYPGQSEMIVSGFTQVLSSSRGISNFKNQQYKKRIPQVAAADKANKKASK